MNLLYWGMDLGTLWVMFLLVSLGWRFFGGDLIFFFNEFLCWRAYVEYGRKEGNVLFNDALNTFYLQLYGVRHMVKDHSAIKETRCRHIGYSFRLAARILLYASSQTG